MNFLNETLLAGIAELSIPFIIHLFHQSRFKVVKSTLVREDSPELDASTSASRTDELFEGIDPITGAKPWMLDVGCWTLDVEGGASACDAARPEAGRKDAQQCSRVREDSLRLDPSTSASRTDELFEEIDPITGARPWMLDVGCRTLDVDGGASVRAEIQTESERGEAPR